MGSKATLQISSDTKDGKKAIEMLVKEMASLREENRRLAEENRKANAESKAAAREQREANKKLLHDTREQQRAERERNAMMTNFATNVMTTVGSYVSLNQIIQVTNRYLERQDELQKSIAQHSLSQGNSQLDIALNLQGKSDADKARAIQIAKNVNRTSGFGNQNAINAAMASAVTSSEGNIDLSGKAVESAARISGGREDLVTAYTGAALGVAMRTGKSTEESLGAVLKAGALGGVEEPALQARLYRGVAASGAARDTSGNPAEAARQSMAIAAALSSITGDKQGNATETATGQFEGRMAKFFAETGNDPGTSFGRIAALQANPALSAQFDKKYNFEEKFDPVITRIAKDANYAGSKTLSEFGKGISYNRSEYEAQRKTVSGLTPELKALDRTNRIKAIAQAGSNLNREEALVQQIEDARVAVRDIADPISYSTFDDIAGPFERGTVGLFGSEIDRARVRVQQSKQVRDRLKYDKRMDFDPNFKIDSQRQSAVNEIESLIQIQEQALAELKQLRTEQQKPTVTPTGMQEAN